MPNGRHIAARHLDWRLPALVRYTSCVSEWDDLQIQISGSPGNGTLVYLPGLHGDWTLVSSFRAALAGRVRFVEFSYPRTTTWSAETHAERIAAALEKNDIRKGWLLAESFGSVLAWELLANQRGFVIHGVILAGGFVRYPNLLAVRIVRAINRRTPLWMIRVACWCYARYAVLRHRRAPETRECVSEFVRRRSEPADRAAICHRYNLILMSDRRELVAQAALPVYHLCGFVDPVVPWPAVRLWLKRNCRTLRGRRLIWRADHNVLGTAPKVAAEQVLNWMAISAHD